MTRRISYVVAFLAGCALTAVAYGSGAVNRVSGGSRETVVQALSKPAPTPAVRPGADNNLVASAAAKVEASVVDVHTQGKAISAGNPFVQDPFLRRFFGGPGGDEDSEGGGGERIVPKGAGSGVIISDDGYIMTNNHVIADADKVTVKIGDKGYDAKVIGSDAMTDIAVVKADAPGVKFTPAELGNSDGVHVGDWAIAVGNPLDIGTTVTLGIISAVNRKGMSAEGRSMQSVIQTDAAINPGNSGGALANIGGQIIGINEAIASTTGGYQGIGFAIPINSARKVASELIAKGKIVRPYLGVSYAPLKSVPPDARKQLGISQTGDDGVIIAGVAPGSPADEAGLKTYDVIIEANRQKITGEDSLNTMIQGMKVGDKVTLLVSREGANRIVTVTLKERPKDYGATSPRRERRTPNRGGLIPVP